MLPVYPHTVFMEVIWDNQFIYNSFWFDFDLILLCTFTLFLCSNFLYMSQIVSWWTSKLRYHWRGLLLMWQSVYHKYILCDMHHNMYGGSWSITDFCWFLNRLIWRNIDVGFICLVIFISWIHDRFMWVVYDILHFMYDINEVRLCCSIHVSTETHGKVLNIIASLSSDVHESTNPVIEGSSVWFFDLFHIFSNKRCLHEEYIFKGCVNC